MRSNAKSPRRSRTAFHKAINTLKPAVTKSIPANARNTSVPKPSICNKRVTSNAGAAACMSVLVFSFGQGTGTLSGLADQLIVSGSGFYAGSQDTVSAGTVLVRPITGGTGRFAGARGWADSEHLGNDSWRHTFHFLKD